MGAGKRANVFESYCCLTESKQFKSFTPIFPTFSGIQFVGSQWFQVKHIEGKGRGVFALNGFQKGDFVVEYHGDLLELAEAKKREAQYAEDPKTGCYMYYFQYQTKTYW